MTTDFLFARQSFIRGMGTIGNLGGEILFNSSESGEEADKKALTMDWREVGRDIQGAMNRYAESSR